MPASERFCNVLVTGKRLDDGVAVAQFIGKVVDCSRLPCVEKHAVGYPVRDTDAAIDRAAIVVRHAHQCFGDDLGFTGQAALCKGIIVRAIVTDLRHLCQLRFSQGIAGITEDLLQGCCVVPPGCQLVTADTTGRNAAATTAMRR